MNNEAPLQACGKRAKKANRKTLVCPKCGRGRIIDASAGTKSEVHTIEDDDPWPADYYAKCKVCKAEVGVRIVR